MGADEGTFATLNADIGFPHGNILGNVALFPLGCTPRGRCRRWEFYLLGGHHLCPP